MDISLFAAYGNPTQALDAAPEAASGFSDALTRANQARGPEPPPGPQEKVSNSEEQKTVEPNAQSKQPDLTAKPDTESTAAAQAQSNAGKDPSATAASASAQAQAAAQAIASTISNAALGLSASTPANVAAKDAKGKEAGQADLSKTQEGPVSLEQLPEDSNLKIANAKSDGTKPPGEDKGGTKASNGGQGEGRLLASQATGQKGNSDPGFGGNSGKSTSKEDGDSLSTLSDSKASQAKSAIAADSPRPAASQLQPGAGALGRQANVSSARPTDAPQVTTSASGAKPELSAVRGLNVIREITDHVEKLATAKSAENVTVHLQADDQTNVMVVVKSLRGDVQAKITTNNESLKNALSQNRPQLEHTFNNKGMNLSGMSVGVDSQGQHSTQERSAAAALRTINGIAKPSKPQLAYAGKGLDLWI